MESNFLSLGDPLRHVLNYLGPRDICKLEQVCQELFKLCQARWEELLKQEKILTEEQPIKLIRTYRTFLLLPPQIRLLCARFPQVLGKKIHYSKDCRQMTFEIGYLGSDESQSQNCRESEDASKNYFCRRLGEGVVETLYIPPPGNQNYLYARYSTFDPASPLAMPAEMEKFTDEGGSPGSSHRKNFLQWIQSGFEKDLRN